MSIIHVENLKKSFKIYRREQGWAKRVKSMFVRSYDLKQAIEDMNFNIEKGEVVGYVGPNGAGKSSTIKILSGILRPSSGFVSVNGIVPYQDRKRNAANIGAVFGQRSQLYWDLPMDDTFALYKKIYQIEERKFKRNVDFFVELLEMKHFLHQPIRQLSLGQKMRANIAVALLHDPPIVFLDEPTIGLDVLAKSRIRDFICDVNREKNTTFIITTHDVHDIEKVCNRLILIDKGNKVFDGSLSEFRNLHSDTVQVTVEFASPTGLTIDPRFIETSGQGYKRTFLFEKNKLTVGQAVTLLTQHNEVVDVRISEPSIEDILKDIYSNPSIRKKGDRLT